jgi:hypothetical protein
MGGLNPADSLMHSSSECTSCVARDQPRLTYRLTVTADAWCAVCSLRCRARRAPTFSGSRSSELWGCPRASRLPQVSLAQGHSEKPLSWLVAAVLLRAMETERRYKK